MSEPFSITGEDMKRLLLIDYKDYTKDMPVFEKHTVRAIITRNGKLAMQKSKYGEYKILGGVVENGESHTETLVREVEEEAGLIVKPDSLRAIGFIEERRRDIFYKERVYVCFTYFYYCDVCEDKVPLKLTDSELLKGYRLAWQTPERIVAANRAHIKEKWKMRDTEFINMIVEGQIHD